MQDIKYIRSIAFVCLMLFFHYGIAQVLQPPTNVQVVIDAPVAASSLNMGDSIAPSPPTELAQISSSPSQAALDSIAATDSSITQAGIGYWDWNSLSTTTKDSLLSLDSNKMEKYVCNITLPDTITTHKIHVSLGTAEGDSSLSSNLFYFDQFSGLPTGTTYSRHGNNVVIEIEHRSYVFPKFFEVKLEDNSGNITTGYKYRLH